MTEKISQSLSGVSETLLMTLYVRACEAQRTNGLIKDDKAVDMVKRLDCDFSQFIMQRHDQIAVIMRMRKFDDHARDFLTRHPNGTVVHIGCGLDTRFERVDNGHVEWFDLDMPDVIALRSKLLNADNERYHMLAASAFEDEWMEIVERFKPRPFLFMAEGVFPYFEETQIKSLFLRLQENFPGAELVCDAHTPFVVWADNIHLALTKVKARLHWSVKTGRDPESWGEGIKMLDEWNYYDADDPGLEAFRWMRIVPGLAKSSGIFHYRLGTLVAETV